MFCRSDYEDNHIPATKIQKSVSPPPPPAQTTTQFQPILPNLTIPQPAQHGSAPTSTGVVRPATNVPGTIPLPLLILNHSGHVQQQNGTHGGGKQPSGDGGDSTILSQGNYIQLFIIYKPFL